MAGVIHIAGRVGALAPNVQNCTRCCIVMIDKSLVNCPMPRFWAEGQRVSKQGRLWSAVSDKNTIYCQPDHMSFIQRKMVATVELVGAKGRLETIVAVANMYIAVGCDVKMADVEAVVKELCLREGNPNPLYSDRLIETLRDAQQSNRGVDQMLIFHPVYGTGPYPARQHQWGNSSTAENPHREKCPNCQIVRTKYNDLEDSWWSYSKDGCGLPNDPGCK